MNSDKVEGKESEKVKVENAQKDKINQPESIKLV